MKTSEGFDARLTDYERAALERLTAPERKGGEGWYRQSPAALHAAAILEAGETRSIEDEKLLERALSLDERAVRRTML